MTEARKAFLVPRRTGGRPVFTGSAPLMDRSTTAGAPIPTGAEPVLGRSDTAGLQPNRTSPAGKEAPTREDHGSAEPTGSMAGTAVSEEEQMDWEENQNVKGKSGALIYIYISFLVCSAIGAIWAISQVL